MLYFLATLLAFVHVGVSLAIVVGLAILYMRPKAGGHAAVRSLHATTPSH